MTETVREPHLYIHVPPIKTGEKFMRFIVPASKVKKFDYSNFVANFEQFKETLFSFKDDEGQKKKGLVLTYAESSEELQKIIKNQKRFRVPKIHDSINISEDSSVSNVSEITQENAIKRAKYEQKERKKTKESNKRSEYDEIINRYVQENSNSVDDDADVSSVTSYNSDSYNQEIEHTSTPQNASKKVLSENKNVGDDEIRTMLNAFKVQTTYFKDKAQFYESEANKWKKKYDELLSNKDGNSNTACSFCAQHKQDAETFAYLDKIYAYSNTSITQEETADDKILLCNGVQCNRKAYADSIKAKEPIEVIKLLSIGVYGYEDLAKRCVRDQKNTQGQVVLDPKRTEAIERVFYRYLRMNGYPANFLKKELNKCSIYHHNAISCARSKLKRQKNVEETLTTLQQQSQEGERLLSDKS